MSDSTVSARRRLARDLSHIARASVQESLTYLRSEPSVSANRIGFTGPPGAGKSTLIGRLAKYRAADRNPLAVVAIDPTSPKTTGALLGDRIRMDALLRNTDVYLRSLPSGESADGLCDNLADILYVLDMNGFREVMVETVGVGQVEYGARVLVDTLILTLLPNSGDQVQAMKAGVVETADIIVVNKSDLPGAARMAQELREVIGRVSNGQATVPVILTAANNQESIIELSDAIDEHQRELARNVRSSARHNDRARFHARCLLNRRLAELISDAGGIECGMSVSEIYTTIAQRLAEESIG